MTRYLLALVAIFAPLFLLQSCQHRDNVEACGGDAACVTRLDYATR